MENKEYIEYRAFVKGLSYANENRVFLNSDVGHAAIVLSEIFERSKTDVRILAGSLDSLSEYDEYITSLSGFIERGGKLYVLLNDYKKDNAKTSDLFKRLAYYVSIGKPIEIKITTAKPYFTSDVDKKPIHFTIGDASSYRVETDTMNRTAICNFNDTKASGAYANYFDGLNNVGKNIDIKELFGF